METYKAESYDITDYYRGIRGCKGQAQEGFI